ncbi:DUF4177 domain-containing protein [Sphingomonas sp.]
MAWEYRTISRSIHAKTFSEEWKWNDGGLEGSGLDEGLNRMGREGWELVSAIPRQEPGHSAGPTTRYIVFVFKRSLI